MIFLPNRFKNEAYFETLQANERLCFLDGKSVLITGASGLLGVSLVDKILSSSNAIVTVVSRNLKDTNELFDQWIISGRLKCIRLDEIERQSNFFDYILHLASPADPFSIKQDPVGVLSVNFLLTLNLLDLIVKQGGGRLLYLSSGEVYGHDELGRGRFEENTYGTIDSLIPRSSYPLGKKVAENLCVAYVQAQQVDFVIARLSHCFGPTFKANDSRIFSDFLKKAITGQDLIMYSSGSQKRTIINSFDAVFAILYLLANGNSKEAYNVADSQVLSIYEWVEKVSEVFGVKFFVDAKPSDFVNSVSSNEHAVLSNKKLLSLGYRQRYSVDVALNKIRDIYSI